MKISARNIFPGKIEAIKPGAVNTEVDLVIAGGERIVAIVTNDSVKSLGLAVGKDATAIVKASSVLVLAEGSAIRLSARNSLAGTVNKLTHGPVSAEVSIALKGGVEVHATITNDAAIELGLKEGSSATAIVKASSVILGVQS
jgi:molybdate transport system regulatory protein